jgi:hypothetical protein
MNVDMNMNMNMNILSHLSTETVFQPQQQHLSCLACHQLLFVKESESESGLPFPA